MRKRDSASSISSPPETLNVEALDAIERFERALHARGSATTTRRYLGACKTLAISRADAPLYQTDWRDAQRLLATLNAQGMAARSLATTLSAWKSWFRILARDDDRYRADAFDAVRVPKPPKRLPAALTEAEMTQLLGSRASDAPQPEDAWALRDHAMFEVLYGCGVRVSELAGLNLSQVDLAASEIRVFGKGRKERVLPLGRQAHTALAAWIAERNQTLAAHPSSLEPAVFIGVRGGRVATTVIRRVLAAKAVAHGISTHVHPHRLRHSFASHVLQASRDLRAVQELMGHASIASTQVYTHLDFQHLASVYDQAHPRAHKTKKP